MGPGYVGDDYWSAVVGEWELLSVWLSTAAFGSALRTLLHQVAWLKWHQSCGATLSLAGLMALESKGPKAALEANKGRRSKNRPNWLSLHQLQSNNKVIKSAYGFYWSILLIEWSTGTHPHSILSQGSQIPWFYRWVNHLACYSLMAIEYVPNHSQLSHKHIQIPYLTLYWRMRSSFCVFSFQHRLCHHP